MADKTYNLKVKLSNGTTVDAGNFTAPQGPKGDKGDTGSQGPKPVKGTDYFTAADKEEIVDDVIEAMPTIPISKGGTGATTAKAAHYNILNSINLEDTNNPYDDTKFIFEYDEPNSSKGVLYKRSGARVWNWIKAKTDALYAAVSHSHSTATTSANGFMSSSDKSKLNGIATGANAYTHPTTSGNKHIPSGGSSGQILRWSSDGTAVWGNDNNTTYTLGSFGVTASATELNYTDGVTSNIQTQLNSKLPLSGGTMTGTITTKTGAGISAKGNNGSWSNGRTIANAAIYFPTQSVTDGSRYDPLIAGECTNGYVWNIGAGAGDQVGFYGYKKSDTSNSTLWSATFCISTGKFTSSKNIKAPTFEGALSGNASTSTKATQDSAGQQINSTYIKGLSVSGKTITYTRGDNTTGTITTQDTNTTYSAATTGAAGLMSAADKTKLDGIAAGANAYSLPTASSSTLGGVKTGSNITNSSGTISLTKANVTSALGYTPPTTNTTYSTATSSTLGLVKIGYTESGKNYPVELNSSGQMYVNVPWTDNNTTYSAATTSNNGLMTTTQVTALNNAVPKSGTTMTGPLVAYNTANTNICLRNSVVFASGSTTTRASTFQLNYYRK